MEQSRRYPEMTNGGGDDMSEAQVVFDDATAYERFMGRWSRAVGLPFLEWVAPAKGARWLDVGCGTGVFTELVLDRCAPASVTAVDPAPAQIDHACRQPQAQRAEFRMADAQSLPFPDATFDIVASALVINFIPDRSRAIGEMRRVARRGGTVAGYVWDFAAGRGTAWPLARGMRETGIEVPRVPGTEDSSLEALERLFKQAGYEEIAVRSFEATLGYSSFEDFWTSQVPPFTPNGKVINALSEAARAGLRAAVRAALPIAPDGSLAYSARANAVKARVP
jgi:ubiquinone/menaquinone biosynthesis C-methylase UbiE